MKIYTRTGDKGLTGLGNGKRVNKASLRMAAMGDVDELNAVLGLCRAENDSRFLNKILLQIQRELFSLGAELAIFNDIGGSGEPRKKASSTAKWQRVNSTSVKQLEKWIDEIEAKLPQLKNFILPSGCDVAAFMHLARTVCRRAERSIIALQKKENINKEIIPYINRMSDLLFVMARYANKKEKIADEKWRV
jgi:cob(I)alamin adenosyltransferase